jgi:hypothetical protein
MLIDNVEDTWDTAWVATGRDKCNRCKQIIFG